MLKYLLLLMIACGMALAAPGINPAMTTVTSDFSRVTITQSATGATKEVVSGILYFQAPSTVSFHVTTPLNQWIIEADGKMTLYYPERKQALILASPNPLADPLLAAVVGIVKEDLGLPAAGFTLTRKELSHQTLTTYWMPPTKNGAKPPGDVVLTVANDHLSAVVMRDTKGAAVLELHFLQYQHVGRFTIPQQVQIIQHQAHATITQTVSYTHLQINTPLPAEVTALHLPPGIAIKDLRQ